MKYSKLEIEKLLVFEDDDKEFYFFEIASTKKKRTLAQNAGLNRWADIICKHTGEDPEVFKKKLLASLFWTTAERMRGEVVIIQNERSTSSLSVDQCTEYIDAINNIGHFLNLWTLIEKRHIIELFNNNQ